MVKGNWIFFFFSFDSFIIRLFWRTAYKVLDAVRLVVCIKPPPMYTVIKKIRYCYFATWKEWRGMEKDKRKDTKSESKSECKRNFGFDLIRRWRERKYTAKLNFRKCCLSVWQSGKRHRRRHQCISCIEQVLLNFLVPFGSN